MAVLSFEALMTQILDIGKAMLIAGAEIYRVEDTITRLITAYGGTQAQVNAVPSSIVVTASFEGREYTLSRRVTYTDTDMELLDRLNALSRRICSEKPSTEEIQLLSQEACARPKYGPYQNALIYALTSCSFTLFFGGGAAEALASAVIGFALFWLRSLIMRTGGNKVFVALLCSAFAALMAMLAGTFGFVTAADKVIIGVVMLLIPGVQLLNGIRDLISGDIQAGIMHISEALFLALVIATGAAGMSMLAKQMGL